MQANHHLNYACIAVIGASASGLTVAHYLKQAGYADVIVLEKAPRVGGKCCPISVGPHVYEMGAVLGTIDYTTTLESLQGTNHTYYANEILSFATVEICACYAKALVAHCFK